MSQENSASIKQRTQADEQAGIQEAIKDLEIIGGQDLDPSDRRLTIWFAHHLAGDFHIVSTPARPGRSSTAILMARAIIGLSRDEVAARLAEQGWRRLPGDPDTSRYSAGTALDGPGRYTERAIGAVLRVRGLDDRVTDDDLNAFFSVPRNSAPGASEAELDAPVTLGLRHVLAARGIDTSQEGQA